MLVNELDQESSPSQVRVQSRSLIRLLRDRGVSADDRVVVSAGNSGDFVVTLLALMELGVSVGLLDARLPAAESAQLVAESGARWFLSDQELDAAYDRVRVGWMEIGEINAAAREHRGSDDVDDDAELTFARWSERSDALVVWSSGSSGVPKGIVRSGESVLSNVERTRVRMGYTEDDVMLPLLPFTHQYGLSIVMLWWSSRASMAIVPSRRIDLALETIDRRGVTVVDAVPAAYHTLLRIIEGRKGSTARIDSVRMWCVGGEPLSADLQAKFTERIGTPLLDGYGTSECGNISLAAPDNAIRCGRPLDGVTIEILDERGNVLPAGEIGEIVVRTPDVMNGVLELGGRVRPVHRPVYRTDDLGQLDEHGNLRVFGRKSAVHRFGHTLYPEVIAERAGACGVPVRVLPVEDPRRGMQLVFVVADPAAQPVAYWRQTIGKFVSEFEKPNRIVVLDEFPQKTNGKTDLQALQDIAASAVALEGVKGVLPMDRVNDAAEVPESAIPFPDRLARLEELVSLLRSRRSEVLELLTEVSNHKTAYGEIDATIAALEGAAAEVGRYSPPAVDQVGVLMPSNIPLYSYALYLAIPSLYSKRVVFRPSRRIEDQTRKLHELLSGVHGLPIVLDDGSQAEFMEGEGARSDVLVFTGTYKNAEKIRTSLRTDQLFLYFGQGVNPYIVGADANVGSAVDGLIRVRMLNSGQDCFGPDVVFVHTSISAQFCNLLCRRVDGLRYGRFEDPTADYGEMFYLDAFDASLEYLRKNREHLAAGGEVNFLNGHLRPTVLIRPAETKVTPPELFAPIFNVVPFTSEEWLHTMLDHPFFEERAMAATVYGGMDDTVEILERRHTVSVNETLIDIDNGNAPFGGTGIRANYASIGKRRYAQPLLVSKAVAEHLSPAETVEQSA
ncbi:hypothetical protein CFN78_11580 [Amycolatopsis antarctica]|uniref:Aldehyde dehydrogenase n=1 Tax=Amycolatopsis antarctica TaxID=1854586 RepID=A0A263D600_9PSEU|nr:aldehyde dehydrogenase family protein [Amycolatopsis antarctica]OZM72896.1 hypothetical protein CFN78_11580 [Amycolatopsis antarctica]